MEPKSGQKPINVLSEYLTSWIRKSSDEALPFDSFESLLPRRIAQKTVERWIFNCNYLHSRVGNSFYDHDLFPEDPDARSSLIRCIDSVFKSISDNTPLDLRSKPNDAIVYELSRDWPPFSAGSRNTIDRFSEMADAFARQNPAFCDEHARELKSILNEIHDEADYYASLDLPKGSDARSIVTRCRTLLPIWCAKELNPLVTLLIWSDRQAIDHLTNTLAIAFRAQGHEDGVVSAWLDATLKAQADYMDVVYDDTDLTGLPVPAIGNLLKTGGFSIEHRDSSHALPRWLLGKSRLIWNVVICSILGPTEAIGIGRTDRTPTKASQSTPLTTMDAQYLAGEVLLRRRFRTGRIETVERLMLDRVCTCGLWKVIGSHFDPNAPLPNSDYRIQYASLGAAYISSEVIGERSAVQEGASDSRFHLELSLQVDSHGRVRIIARDLDSKNGSCVLRAKGGAVSCYAFSGRSHLTREDWARRLEIAQERIEMVHELSLERNDLIQLADSCFELI